MTKQDVLEKLTDMQLSNVHPLFVLLGPTETLTWQELGHEWNVLNVPVITSNIPGINFATDPKDALKLISMF